MKKIIIITASVLLLIATSIFLYLKISKENGGLRPLYFVPSSTVYFIESEEPIEAWKMIKTNPLWKHLLSNETFGELAAGISSLDEIMDGNQFLFELLGNRKLIVSTHLYKHNDYDFLYLVDIENNITTEFVESILKKSIDKESYRLTSRLYNENLIIELFDKSYKETLYLSVYENILISSYQNSLVESSLDEYLNPKLGRDVNFIEVSSKVKNSDYFKVFLNYNNLEKYTSIFLEEDNSFLSEVTKSLFYTGLSFDLEDNGLMKMNGFSGVNDTLNSFLGALNRSGSSKIEADNVMPGITSFYMSLGFDDVNDFIYNFEKTYKLQDEKGYKDYIESNKKVENFLGISLKENFYSWIDDEVSYIQLQAGGLGTSNEFAFLIKANDIDNANNNLEIIKKQIKRKTPGKFKSVNYKGYQINYLAIKGFFKALMGDFFSKLEKPYFVIIDDYVVFSNHPQTLRIIIDNYVDGTTLNKLRNYQDFKEGLSTGNNVMCYLNTSKLYSNLLELSDQETKQSLIKNKKYITCFDQIAFQMTNDNSFFETNLNVQFEDPENIKIIDDLNFNNLNDLKFVNDKNVEKTEDLFETLPVILTDFDVKKFEAFYKNDIVQVEVEIKDGLKHGLYKQYYDDGSIMLKGKFEENLKEGVWKFYNKEGVVIEKRHFTRNISED